MPTFWRSVDLAGNQTQELGRCPVVPFWRSVDLAGNQTPAPRVRQVHRFGAVSIWLVIKPVHQPVVGVHVLAQCRFGW